MIDRRAFIGAVGAACVVGVRMEAKKIQRLGMQLYTVRTEMEKDVDATLAKVAALGYKEVEFAGYFKRTPAQIRDSLKKAGLTAPAAHIDYPSLAADKLPAAIEAAQTIGHRYLVNPWLDESLRKEPDIWKRVADTFNRAGAATQKAGIQFAYHNHHFEFAIHNLNSDRSGRGFTVNMPAGTTISNACFRDINHHSGEIWSGTNWATTIGGNSVNDLGFRLLVNT